MSNQDIFVKTGFASPSEEFTDNKLDLNKFLIKHPEATFFIKISGNGLRKHDILDGDILLIDRGAKPASSSIALFECDEEFKVLPVRMVHTNKSLYNYKNISLWGAATTLIRTLK